MKLWFLLSLSVLCFASTDTDKNCALQIETIVGPSQGLVSNSLANRIAFQAQTNGGITYALSTQTDMKGTANFVLSIYPELTEWKAGETVNHRDVENFCQKHEQLLEKPHHALGIWVNHEQKRVELDVVVTLPQKSSRARLVAWKLADQFNQEAFFDLKTRQLISLPHDGKAIPLLPSFSQRLEMIEKSYQEANQNN